MAAKDFSAIDTSKQLTGTENGEVLNQISRGKRKKKPQTLPDTDERLQREMDVTATRGRRGCALPRINLAFSMQNYDYIRTVSKAQHQTMTAFLDEIMTRERLANQDLLEQSRARLAIEEKARKAAEKAKAKEAKKDECV